MAYIPSSGSVVAFQSDPTKFVGTVSVVSTSPQSVAVLQGTNPWQVNVPSPSTIAYQLAGSIMAVSATVNTGNSSVQVVGIMPPQSVSGVGLFNVNHVGNGSVLVTQNDPTKLVGTMSVMGNLSVLGTVPVTQATASNPWIITGSVQGAGAGTQYGENQQAASVTGTAVMFKSNLTTSILTVVSPANPLPASVQGNVGVTQITTPWAVNMPSPSVVVIHPAGSVVQVRTDNASVVTVLTNSSVTTLQGTNPWQVNVPSPSYIAYQLAGSVMAVNATVNTGNSSVQVLGGVAVIGSVATLQGTNPWLIGNSSVLAFQGTTPWTVNSILGTYQEKAAAGIASALGQVILFKNNTTTSTLAAVSTIDPLPVQGSVATLQGTTPWIVNVPTPSYLSIQLAGSVLNANISGSIAAFVGNNIGSIVGTYAEDSASNTTDKGLFVLGVRNDTLASVTSNDGDYGALTVGPSGEVVTANSPITKWISAATSVMYGTSVQAIAPPGASIFTYITGIQVINESANLSRVTFTQGLGRVPASMIAWAIAPATGGSNMVFPNPIRVLDNNGVSASISGISSVYVMIEGFNSKS